jgi:hypothetical protein
MSSEKKPNIQLRGLNANLSSWFFLTRAAWHNYFDQ